MSNLTTPARCAPVVPYRPGAVGPWAEVLVSTLALAAIERYAGVTQRAALHMEGARKAAAIIIGKGCES